MWGNQYGREYSGIEGSLGQVITKALTDAVNTTSSIIRATTKRLSDNVNTISTILKAIARFFTSTIGTISVMVFAGREYVRELLDELSTSDLVSLAASYVRALSDLLITSDIYASSQIFRRILTDSIAAASTLAKRAGKVFADSLQPLENYIMRLNGIVIRCANIARTVVADAWTIASRTVGSWGSAERQTGDWTNTPKEET